MHQTTGAHRSIGPSAKYCDKPSQLTSSVFRTVPSIYSSEQPNLSSSGLSTGIPMITPNTTPIRDPTQSPFKNLLGSQVLYLVKIQ